MANTDQPSGFTPVGTTDGSDWHGKLRTVQFADDYAASAFVGDIVKLTDTGSVDGKYEQVEVASAGDANIGAIVEILPSFEDEGSLTQMYKPADTERLAKVCFGSEVLYEVQETSIGGALTADAIGSNIELFADSGNVITGISGHQINSSTVTTGTAQFRIKHIARKSDNELGDFCRWIVTVNENQDDNGVGV